MEDDFPPPLEDMSDQLTYIKQMKDKTNPFAQSSNDEEEVRLAPKIQNTNANETSIPMSDDYDKPKKTLNQGNNNQSNSQVVNNTA